MSNSIGILDSGVGGLSVWREIVSLLPDESIIYLADQANIPYGNKSAEEITVLAKRSVGFLVKQQIKLLVIACNTITVTCLSDLRLAYPDMPIIGVVPVVKAAAEVSKNKRIGVLSTVATANSEYQRNLINKFADDCFVLNIGTDKLVPSVESGEVDGSYLRNILQKELRPFEEQNVDALVLGCTHFPFLEPVMKRMVGEKTQILDSGKAVARQVERILKHNRIGEDTKSFAPTYDFYTTGDAIKFEWVAKKLVGEGFNDKIEDVCRGNPL